ncbi:hypothetical protein EMIHUDRAFT_106136 [Emiliania huxleyi CCMP1516]|uniref:ShKT domain-containing protein n=3 Tax=Emiliania huxleyi TaxID=2903 RepID=A0A0D3IB02_EMIH1|nr:hypothetical protein EMIHUDRAFT_106136 [Emiliania huxleyi CCMP1516]EOD08437.1 hypothetical protein EMIHUDRAFT_106136 [Emiliania huxleyi CCMP1516]|eukprot:XP_005760866.1 hypothetical protein EMIHUDRAFT_106136 [Emiliania huxleyi CCMP1516]
MPHRKVCSDKPQWGNMTWFELPISQGKVCIEIQQRGKSFRPTPIAIVSQLGRSSVFLFVIDRRREAASGEAGISATLESGRTMSWATPVRSHVVVTTMARSITVERSVPALLGLARVSGALPATGPSFFEHCLESQLPAAPHLILVEFTVNLDHNPAAFERMLRKLLTLPRRPAVVVVSMHGWRLTDSRGRRVSPWRCAFPRAGGKADLPLLGSDQQWEDQDPRGDEDRVAELCRYYDVPLVSMRAALLEPVRRGAVRLDEFMVDCRHPKAEGHLAMARAVLDRLLRTRPLAEGAACFDFSLEQRGKPGLARQAEAEAPRRGRRGAGDGGGRRPTATLPDPKCSDHDVGEAAHNGQSQACAQQQPWCHSRKVFKRCPLTCGLCSRVRGGANATTSVLWLAYLSSYQHMGRALVRCSGGCECGPVEIDAHVRSERVSVTAVQRLAVVHTAAHGGPACALDLRILPTSSSGEHKWKLLGLLLGGNLAGDAWMPPGSIRYDGDTRSFFFPGADEKLPTQTSFGR